MIWSFKCPVCNQIKNSGRPYQGFTSRLRWICVDCIKKLKEKKNNETNENKEC